MRYNLLKAHKFSSNNKPELEQDRVCGCFDCLRIFHPSEIREWVTEENGIDWRGTALCPFCGIDSVIGESSGYPITDEFLEEMHRFWMDLAQSESDSGPESQSSDAFRNRRFTLQLNPIWDGTNTRLLTDIGYALEKGTLFAQDDKTALQVYRFAAEQGNADAMNNLGWLYQNGLGCESDLDEAMMWYEKAATCGHTTAMVNLGNCYESGEPEDEPDDHKAFHWYQKAAERGDRKGRFNLANCYHYGRGTEQDHEKAFALFSELAHQGEPDALFYMGLYYQEGLAVDCDYEKARFYYLQGVEKDDAYCNNQMGVLYAEGLGVEKNAALAARYYQNAGDLGDPLGYTNLGWLCESGELGEADLNEARKWYVTAARQGEEQALEALERLDEDFCEEDLTAVEWIQITRDWREQKLPAALLPVLEKWERIAKKEMETYEYMWPAKLVQTRFTYEGRHYLMTPETFGIPEDLCECFQGGPWVERKYGGGFDHDLEAIGCENVYSDGMMD